MRIFYLRLRNPVQHFAFFVWIHISRFSVDRQNAKFGCKGKKKVRWINVWRVLAAPLTFKNHKKISLFANVQLIVRQCLHYLTPWSEVALNEKRYDKEKIWVRDVIGKVYWRCDEKLLEIGDVAIITCLRLGRDSMVKNLVMVKSDVIRNCWW